MKPLEILNALENNEKVSRWTVFRNKSILIDIMSEYGYSEDTQHQVYYLIDSAIESL